MKHLIAGLCLLLPGIVLGKDYFTAAVFEHRARALNTSQESPKEIITSNLKIYEKAIHLAAKKGTDIIVFNEYGLYLRVDDRNRLKKLGEHVPNPGGKKINPCTDKFKSLMLSSLSCYARQYNMYIVANFGDNQPCEDTCDAGGIDDCNNDCPEDGSFYYNGNVVFDREGNVIAKYHKTHPFLELVNSPEKEFTTFKTDFGTFGTFICFDIIWEEAVTLAKEYGIDNVVYSTFWYDDIAPINSVELHQAWALENKVNIMAANTHRPGTGSLGSGIYSKDTGALIYSYEPDGESKLLITNVKINKDADIPELKTIIMVTDEDVFEKETETGDKFPEYCLADKMGLPKEEYTDYRCFKSHTRRHTVVKLEGASGEVKACHNDFCCSLKYTARDMKENFYLTAFAGTNEVKDYFHYEEETCLLLRCDPFEDKPCVLKPSTSKTVFEKVELKAHFEADRVYATATKNKFRLAPKKEWQYTTENSVTTLKFESDSDDPLLKIALFGRKYHKDPPFVPYLKSVMKK